MRKLGLKPASLAEWIPAELANSNPPALRGEPNSPRILVTPRSTVFNIMIVAVRRSQRCHQHCCRGSAANGRGKAGTSKVPRTQFEFRFLTLNLMAPGP